ncbi:hypothetical protein [Ignicoccus hospitalis]|uniref:hypothetical protein n=1 Tax=Ignicoccus hospitalis TaxID=160233 RepID=UPI0011D061B1|nr:hypothetical protein [Ignicoccus hospitalis]HIH90075.1 hypothetical protein [Desulfurococcaceae archaeon]
MPGPEERERYGEVGKAVALEVLSLFALTLTPPYVEAVLGALVAWYFYSRIMLVGPFEGSSGRLLAFLIVALPYPLLALALADADLLYGLLIAFAYWVRVWR